MMTKAKRDDLFKLVRARAKLAREEVAAARATRKAEFQQQLAREYKLERDGVWKKHIKGLGGQTVEAVICDRCRRRLEEPIEGNSAK